jgi:hypothetical protein
VIYELRVLSHGGHWIPWRFVSEDEMLRAYNYARWLGFNVRLNVDYFDTVEGMKEWARNAVQTLGQPPVEWPEWMKSTASTSRPSGETSSP